MNIDVNPDSNVSYFQSIYDKIASNNPILVFIMIFIIIAYYLVFKSIGIQISKPSSSISNITGSSGKFGLPKSTGLTLIEVSLWGIFLFLLMINGLQFFLSMDVKAMINDIFSPHPKVDITVESPELEKAPVIEKEVFHIPGNKYTYEDAKAMCKAYNSDLASYDQIKKSHSSGGEWCSYGWSKDQLTLFPTQRSTYDKLKKIKGHENDCGRPGINGGFIDNPKVKFGVNCFGYKPEITPTESDHMANQPHYPKSAEDLRIDAKIEKYKEQIPEVMLAPFNKTKWSRI